MDIKTHGVPREVLSRALEQARQARLSILDIMDRALASPRATISPYAPRILTITISKDKIREVIGPGGKTIRSIVEQTGCKIEVNDDGRVDIASADEEAARRAVDMIRELTAEPELGKTYLGRVVRITNFGAFVEILPGVDGLLHISEIAERRLDDVRQELDEGDEVLVKVIEIDPQGRVRLSRRALLRERKGQTAAPARATAAAEAGGAVGAAARPRPAAPGGGRPHGGRGKGPSGGGRGPGGGGPRSG
jgi:polyribonucleotide nucleotidyltransferase